VSGSVVEKDKSAERNAALRRNDREHYERCRTELEKKLEGEKLTMVYSFSKPSKCKPNRMS